MDYYGLQLPLRWFLFFKKHIARQSQWGSWLCWRVLPGTARGFIYACPVHICTTMKNKHAYLLVEMQLSNDVEDGSTLMLNKTN